MKKVDLVNMAKSNLLRRKLRTSLTVLGIVIGAISILLMVSLGIGLQESITKEFSSIGSANVIQVYQGSTSNGNVRLSENKDGQQLKEVDVDNIKAIDGVVEVIPTIQYSGTITSGKYSTNTSLVGVDPMYFDQLGLSVKKGSGLSGLNDYEAVFGPRVIEGFYAGGSNEDFYDDYEEDYEDEGLFGGVEEKNYNVNVLEDRLRLSVDKIDGSGNHVYPMSGVGILQSGDYTSEQNVYMSIDGLRKILKEAQGEYKSNKNQDVYSILYVKVEDMSRIKEISAKIERQGYGTFSSQQILDSINSTFKIVQIVLGALGGISLMVAAIGITNTMVMAVSERKKEIGVMKVIGATISDIKQLFLLESAMIGAVGGLVGIVISVSIAALISSEAVQNLYTNGQGNGFTFGIPLWLIGAGVLFTTLIGVMSGYLPARKAMASSALDALRNE